jgi:hypothetical protein
LVEVGDRWGGMALLVEVTGKDPRPRVGTGNDGAHGMKVEGGRVKALCLVLVISDNA